MALDSSEEASQVQADVLRRLGANRRLELACEASEAVRELARVRIRMAHPEFDSAGVRDQLIFELYGVRIGAQ